MKKKYPSIWIVTKSIWKILKRAWETLVNFKRKRHRSRQRRLPNYHSKQPVCKVISCKIAANWWLPVEKHPNCCPSGKKNATRLAMTYKYRKSWRQNYKMNHGSVAKKYRKNWPSSAMIWRKPFWRKRNMKNIIYRKWWNVLPKKWNGKTNVSVCRKNNAYWLRNTRKSLLNTNCLSRTWITSGIKYTKRKFINWIH